MFPAMIYIFVKTWSGKTITFYVQHHYTIRNVKDRIFQKLRIRCDFQNILFAGKMLEDNRDLASYGVQMHSTLSMVFSPSQTIIPMRIDYIENPIQRFTTICNLKAMIEKKTRFPVKEIFFHEEALQYHRSLADYGINSDSIVRVVIYKSKGQPCNGICMAFGNINWTY